MIGQWFEIGVLLLSKVIAWFTSASSFIFSTGRCLSFRADELTEVKLTVRSSRFLLLITTRVYRWVSSI